MKVWFDFTNPPHVNFYEPMVEYLKSRGLEIEVTARSFVETTALIEQKGIPFRTFGIHGGQNRLSKVSHLLSRELLLLKNVKGFSYSISSNYEAPLASWIKGRKAIVFDDNDISPNWLYSKFADFVVCPKYINARAMYNMGIKKNKLIQYNGFKEDIYIASYTPDPKFLEKIPYKRFVTVRPENIQASYVPDGVTSIVPQLLEEIGRLGLNVLYLPRYSDDMLYCRDMSHVYIPSTPLNGLDVCFYSDAVLTGAGTFSREAAIMGTPAVSFFAGTQFLSVDQTLFQQERILYSRDVNIILNYLRDLPHKKSLNLSSSKAVQKEVFSILDEIIS